MSSFWILLIAGAILLYLLWSEMGSQDCLNRSCNNSTPPVNLKDTPRTAIDKTVETLRKNHTIVGWRRALVIAIIVSIPIILFLVHRWPSGFEFLIIVTIIFVVVYFSSVWLQASWWGQNDLKIEKALMQFRRLSPKQATDSTRKDTDSTRKDTDSTRKDTDSTRKDNQKLRII